MKNRDISAALVGSAEPSGRRSARTSEELSGDFVEGPYRFEILDGVSHSIPGEAPTHSTPFFSTYA